MSDRTEFSKSIKRRAYGIREPKKSRPLPGTKASGLKKRMDGSVVRR